MSGSEIASPTAAQKRLSQRFTPRTWKGRLIGGLAVWALVATVFRLAVVPTEHCGPGIDLTEAEVMAAAGRSVDWLVDNQNQNGSWLYRYHRSDDEDLGGYNLVRHAGLLVSLYQADRAGFDGAREAADSGMDFVLDRLVDTGDGGQSFGPTDGLNRVGGAALAVAGLVERREHTGDDRYDDVMMSFGRFMEGQVTETGSVNGDWDPATGAAVPDSFSQFYTGEVFWALARLHTIFPDQGWDAPTERIMRYVAEDRDRVEPWFPDIPDHWAAYAMAEMARWPEYRNGDRAFSDAALAYATRQAQFQSVQIRYESQRTNSLISHYTRGRQTLGAGLGTIGEATDALWRFSERRPEWDVDRTVLRERTLCTASVLVERQVDDREALTFPNPTASKGAWFQFEITQMDDQQHSLSALIEVIPVIRDEVPQ